MPGIRPLIDDGKIQMKDILAAITDPLEREVLQYVLLPWLSNVDNLDKQGKLTFKDIGDYFGIKNAVLEELKKLEAPSGAAST